MKKQDILRLILAIFTCHLAGFVGSFFTRPAIDAWYGFLNKPSFSPPNWLFAPAWLTLYTLMGIALYLISKTGVNQKNKKALWLFYIHLIINALWSIIFFGLRSPLGGLITIAILWIMILILIKEFWSINKTASRLLWPYYLWVSFASLLNLSIWLLN
jgi:translocator protein